MAGPGHDGPTVVGNTYLEGTYSEIYPNISQDEAGLQKLFLQFSFPGGIPSHASPECPGSIHEGGELGYSLSQLKDKLLEHKQYIDKHGEDLPEIRNWKWGAVMSAQELIDIATLEAEAASQVSTKPMGSESSAICTAFR